MRDLGSANEEGEWRRLLTLAGAVAALLAGLLAITAGGAKLVTSVLVGTGLPEAPARQIAIATSGTLPPVVLGGAIAYFQPARRLQLFGLAGVAVALTGIAVGLPMGFDTIAPIVGVIYGTGLVLVLGALVQGILDGSASSGSTPTDEWESGTTSGMYRSSRSDAMPADGGEAEDDDLTFLLEDESDEK